MTQIRNLISVIRVYLRLKTELRAYLYSTPKFSNRNA